MSLISASRAGLVFLVAGSALVAACGGGAATESKSADTSSKTGAGSSGGAGGELTVTLSEWALKPSATTAKAGKAEIKVTNSGTTPHEFKLIKTDVAADKLEKANGIVDEAKYKPVVASKQLNAGEKQELSADLTAGKYVLICNVAGHYDLGMHTAFAVN